MAYLALALARPIDLAIFGTLGLLWVFGALFIVVLYRWIFRFEREQAGGGPTAAASTPSKPAAEARPAAAPVSVTPVAPLALTREAGRGSVSPSLPHAVR